MAKQKILRTKAERLAYIEKCVKRGLKEREKMKKLAVEMSKETEADDNGY